MQQKGERENMTNGECCRYIRTYSELEGLQHACTLVSVSYTHLGYDNPLYFSRVFKKEYGVSPAQYRKNLEESTEK